MENKKPFFSIVMPVYKVEAFLEQAVQSVLEQTFQDFEIILVDDCSPDNCGKICDCYAGNYENIRVIHHPVNGGLSAARNSGLAAAEGEYIWFMDSDDYVETSLLEEVYQSLQKNRAQLVIFGLVEDNYDKNDTLSYQKVRVPDLGYYKSREELREQIIHLENDTFLGYVWNKFYDLKYLRETGIKYEKIILIEDILFNVQYCKDIERMNCLNIAPYHYNRRIGNSLTSAFVKDYYAVHKQRVQMIYDLYESWDCCTDEVKEILAGIYARYILSAIQRNCSKQSGMSVNEQRKWIKDIYSEELFISLADHMVPKSKSMTVFMSAIRKHRTSVCLGIGQMVYIVKDKFPILFAKAKEGR